MRDITWLFLILAVLQVLLLLWLVVTLHNTLRKINGNSLLNWHTKFNENQKVIHIAEALALPSNDDRINELISANHQHLSYYLDYLDFIAAIQVKNEINLNGFYFLFGDHFINLQTHWRLIKQYDNKERVSLEKVLSFTTIPEKQ